MTATLIRRSPTPAHVNPAGELDGQLIPWNTPATVADRRGGPAYTETWAPGALTPAAVVPVYATHRHTETGELERGELIGRADRLEDRPDGLYGTITLAATAAAQTVRELARTVGAFLSIEADLADPPARAGATVTRTAGTLTGLAVILPPDRPAFATAAVTAVRTGETPTMTDTPTEETEIPPPPDEDDENDNGDDENGDTVGRAAVAELVRSEVARTATTGRRVAAHPLARFDRFVDAADAAWNDPELARTIGRALADQTTPNNPGVVPPGFISDVKGIIDLGRRVVTALGANPDPGEGLDIEWPYFDGNLLALVGVQAAEKTEITTARVDLKKGSQPLATYAGGSDISYQLIRRSRPSYRDAYLRIMSAAYAAVTDKAATDQLEVASNAGVTYDLAADADGAAFRAAVFQASVMVEDATGQPASVVLAATDVFVKVGSLLTPPPIVNVSGTASASTLSVDISQLQVVRAPALAPGTAIVTNKQAAAWAEDFGGVVTAEDVAKLGQNVAIWGLGALATFFPAGVVTLNPTGVPAATGQSSGRSKK
jgi:hypothetical protein